jgi:integrase
MIANLERCRNGRLFPWPSRWSVYRWLRSICKATGTTYTPHQSRHALATALLERGVPDKQAAEYGAWRPPFDFRRNPPFSAI